MNPIAEKALARNLKLLEIPDMTPVASAVPPPTPATASEALGDYDSRIADKFVMRLPEGMRPRVAARARLEHRSMNGVLVHAAQQYLEGQEELETLLESVKLLKAQLKAALAAAESGISHA